MTYGNTTIVGDCIKTLILIYENACILEFYVRWR